MSETDGSGSTESPVHQLKVHGSPSPAHKHGHASIHIGHIETCKFCRDTVYLVSLRACVDIKYRARGMDR